MRGFDLRRRVRIDPLLRFVGHGVIRAALFDLGPYPAAIRAEGQVRGDLYVVLDADALLARVDAVEGYKPDDVQHSQYTRAAVPVSLGRRRAWAWAYFYQPSLGSAVWIPSGDYRRHVTRTGGPFRCQRLNEVGDRGGDLPRDLDELDA